MLDKDEFRIAQMRDKRALTVCRKCGMLLKFCRCQKSMGDFE